MWRLRPGSWISKLFPRIIAAWRKLIVGPIRYSRGGGYDAERYWSDRFTKHGLSLRGPGNEGLTDKENSKVYEQAGREFVQLCRKEDVNFETARILEIGVGTGFYTDLVKKQGATDYLGLDITDVLFDHLAKEYPSFRFERQDIVSDQLNGKYDLIIMMDVVEHIVDKEKLSWGMENVRRCLAEDGVFVVSGIHDRTRKRLFYVHSWSPQDILRHFPGYRFSGPIPFRDNSLVIVRRSCER
jgi:2-polyprenyl-3-methyl-5-hydroxy-6-metoxy-1,4-benzoquinol methylase